MRRNVLIALLTVSVCLPGGTARAAGIPVIDSSNLAQSTISAMEDVNATVTRANQLVSQVNTELQTFQSLQLAIQEATGPATELLGQLKSSYDRLNSLYDEVNRTYGIIANLDKSVLDKFQDLSQWERMLQNGGVSSEEVERRRRELDQLVYDNAHKYLTGQAARDEAREQERKAIQNLGDNARNAMTEKEVMKFGNELASDLGRQVLSLREQAEKIHEYQVMRDHAADTEKAARQAFTDSFFNKPYVNQPMSRLPTGKGF